MNKFDKILYKVTYSTWRILLLCVVLFLVGSFLGSCANMTPEGKRTAWIVTGIVVAGGIVAASNSGSSDSASSCIESIRVNADGSSDHVCR